LPFWRIHPRDIFFREILQPSAIIVAYFFYKGKRGLWDYHCLCGCPPDQLLNAWTDFNEICFTCIVPRGHINRANIVHSFRKLCPEYIFGIRVCLIKTGNEVRHFLLIPSTDSYESSHGFLDYLNGLVCKLLPWILVIPAWRPKNDSRFYIYVCLSLGFITCAEESRLWVQYLNATCWFFLLRMRCRRISPHTFHGSVPRNESFSFRSSLFVTISSFVSRDEALTRHLGESRSKGSHVCTMR
jgi:hypothetical protein